jgi:hypothetical protein
MRYFAEEHLFLQNDITILMIESKKHIGTGEETKLSAFNIRLNMVTQSCQNMFCSFYLSLARHKIFFAKNNS